MSALIIIAHVKEGVDLALKHGLNQQVIDVISSITGLRLSITSTSAPCSSTRTPGLGAKL
jgi:hypothetical protein